MNILILNWRDPKNPKSGGAEIVTMKHASYWVKKGNNVTWFTSKFKNSKNQEKINGVNIVRRGNSITVYLLAPLFYIFSRNKFDIVIDEIHGLPFFTPIYVKKPKIAFIHEVAREIWDYMFPFPINIVGRFIEPKYFKLYKNVKFWVPSKSTVDDLVSVGIERRSCKVIYCGIDNKTVGILPKKEIYPTFIFVSRVVKMKGIEEVVRAFFRIARVEKNSKLWIVGDGEKKYVMSLKNLIRSYGFESKISFLGKVSEKKKLFLLRKAHILLHASIREGWGLVVIEAASQATPSIVYNVSGLKNSVKDKITGKVLKNNTPDEMAKEALMLLKNTKSYLIYQRNGLEWAKSLNWKDSLSESLSLLKSEYDKSR